MNKKIGYGIVMASLIASSGSAMAEDKKTDARARMKDAVVESSNDIATSDLWLEAKLGTTILLNRHLSLFDIDTSVKNQVATLSGVVESEIDKDLAGEVAKAIDGISEVENNLTVDQSKSKAARNDKTATFSQRVEDMTTTAVVKSKLLKNSNLSALDISVETTDGEVTLTGFVGSDKEKDLAATVTENTDGVREIENNLRIRKS